MYNKENVTIFMKNKPIILVPAFNGPSVRGGNLDSAYVDVTYLNALTFAGGIPLIISPDTSSSDIARLCSLGDGLLIPGGVDIDPLRYGEEKDETIENINLERDELEFALVKCFLEMKKPVMGICRGMQVLNVSLSGNLHRDIKKEIEHPLAHEWDKTSPISERYHFLAHSVAIDPESALSEYIPSKEVSVNSLHHQAVKVLGKNLRIGAKSPDGVIEEIESSDMSDRWLLGVQWHPEAILEARPENKIIFEKFIEASLMKSDKNM